MNNDGNFTKFKRFIAIVSGVWVGYASVFLSRKGIGFGDDLDWMAWGIAIALFCAEFMFNSKFEELSWTMIFIGVGAYLYSIGVNINGFYYYRGIEGNIWNNFDLTNFGGGLFMDIYPEIAVAWALRESKVGDFLGNILKAWNDPNKMIQQVSQNKPYNNVPQSIPRQPQNNQPRKEERPVPQFLQERHEQKKDRSEPTYHPMSYRGGEDDSFRKIG